MTYNPAWLDSAYEAHLDALAGRRHEADWGYSFFYCPAVRIQTASVGIIGLNPGGGDRDDDPKPPQNRAWQHDGFAYLDQRWGLGGGLNPLQQQVKHMLDLVGQPADRLFAAQLVPFRSPSWSRLQNRQVALTTFEPAWRELLAQSSVRLWLSLGYLAGETLARWLETGPWSERPSGWGRTQIRLATTSSGVVVAALPHLSRYKLFSQSGERLALAHSAIADAVQMSGIHGETQ